MEIVAQWIGFAVVGVLAAWAVIGGLFTWYFASAIGDRTAWIICIPLVGVGCLGLWLASYLAPFTINFQ